MSRARQTSPRKALRFALISSVGAAALFGLASIGELGSPAKAQIAVINQGYVPYSEAPIFYRTAPLHDPVTELQKKIASGEAQLTWEPQHGYLRSVLKLLDIPISSQTLVFSKTSFQAALINPEHPRALYYNDDVYVGSVHGGKAIEIVSFDPNQGAVFYLVDEPKVAKAEFQRAELDCTQCHIAAGTRGIPGVLLRSVHTQQTGVLSGRTPSYITDQKSPLNQRWGGWYVGGLLGKSTMANQALAAPPPVIPVSTDPAAPRPIPQLVPLEKTLDRAAYLQPDGDGVAMLVLGHQAQMHNLITLTNYQTRLALHDIAKASGATEFSGPAPAFETLPEKQQQQIQKPAEQLLRYMLFSNETPLGGLDAKKVIAESGFAREFPTRGVRDSRKRSLRDLDLHDRTFRYPLSYLIYNVAFDTIPEPAKGYVYHRLLQVLTGEDTSPDFANLSPADRQAILSILLETKPGLPAEWLTYAKAHRLRVAKSQQARLEQPRPLPGRPPGPQTGQSQTERGL